jgi:hypothetical protein
VTISPQGRPIIAGPQAVNVEGNVDGVVVANINIHGRGHYIHGGGYQSHGRNQH